MARDSKKIRPYDFDRLIKRRKIKEIPTFYQQLFMFFRIRGFTLDWVY